MYIIIGSLIIGSAMPYICNLKKKVNTETNNLLFFLPHPLFHSFELGTHQSADQWSIVYPDYFPDPTHNGLFLYISHHIYM